jgi:hypothetical protein
MQQLRKCAKRCLLFSLSRGHVTRTNGTSQSSSLQLADGRQTRRGSSQEVVPGGSVGGGGRYCCKSLRSNAELGARTSPASKDVTTGAEEATAWEAVTSQPLKIQQTAKN